MKILRLLVLICALAALPIIVPNAGAAETIGRVASPGTSHSSACPNCNYLQSGVSFGGPNYTIPSAGGVITSFSYRVGGTVAATDTIAFDLWEQVAASSYKRIATIAPMSVPLAQPGNVVTVPTRLTAVAGQTVGLQVRSLNTGHTAPFETDSFPAQDTVSAFAALPAVGANASTSGPLAARRLNLSANLEPDADRDGYGDETQDGCPSETADQGACVAPGITQFKFSLNRFEVEKKGLVLQPAATAQGTTIIVTLFRAARVNFELSQMTSGRKVGASCKKQTRKNRKKKKCTRYLKPYKFSRLLPLGTSNLGFSGRIKSGSKTVSLPAGKYRASATPFGVGSGLTGPVVYSNFTVVAPKKAKKK